MILLHLLSLPKKGVHPLFLLLFRGSVQHVPLVLLHIADLEGVFDGNPSPLLVAVGKVEDGDAIGEYLPLDLQRSLYNRGAREGGREREVGVKTTNCELYRTESTMKRRVPW